MDRPIKVIAAFLLLSVIGATPSGKLHLIGGEGGNRKYPAVALGPGGEVWVAYSSFVSGINDEIEVVRIDGSKMSSPEQLTSNDEPDDAPAILVDGDGAVWVFWAGMRDWDWDVFCRRYVDGEWSPEENLTRHKGIDWNLAAAKGPGGEIWIVWEANRGVAQNDIMAMMHKDGQWQAPLVVSGSPHHEARPAVSVDSSGNLWVAYESFRDNNSDIYLRRVRPFGAGEELRVTGHAAFDFAPAVLADGKGRVWVSFTSTRVGEEYSRGTVNVHVKVLENGEWKRPVIGPGVTPGLATDMNRQEEPTRQDMGEWSRLIEDADGRVWVFWQNRMIGSALGVFNWNVHGRYFHGKGASRPLAFKNFLPSEFKAKGVSGPLSPVAYLYTRLQGVPGATDRHPAVAADQDGGLVVAWDSSPPFGKCRICVKRSKAGGKASDPLLVDDHEPDGSLPDWHATFDTARTVGYNGKTYSIYFGDLHTHTGVSDGIGYVDHVFITQRRYYKLDFGASTDHAETNNLTGSEWARVQSLADLHNHPAGGFVAFPGYEWTQIRESGGHHTVVFPKSGVPEVVYLTTP